MDACYHVTHYTDGAHLRDCILTSKQSPELVVGYMTVLAACCVLYVKVVNATLSEDFLVIIVIFDAVGWMAGRVSGQ